MNKLSKIILFLSFSLVLSSCQRRTFTVTWENYDGTVLETDEGLLNDEMPSYDGATPTKPRTEMYTYTFSGWSPTVSAINMADQVYRATFTESINKYRVVWKNSEGQVLETDYDVSYGEIPHYDGETPTKESSVSIDYTFANWNPRVVPCSGAAEEIVYTAGYSESPREYLITWKNYDGSLIYSDYYTYGTTPVFGWETPTKPRDQQYTYTFSGWSPAVGKVTQSQEYTATFDKNLRSYSVSWLNYDGELLDDELVQYGDTPVYKGETPVKPQDQQYSYLFIGWNPEIEAVTDDVSYTAQYKGELRSYTVYWVNEDGRVLEEDTAPYGTTPTYDGDTPVKDADAQYSYTFKGWSSEIVPVTGDTTYTACYNKKTNLYTINFIDYDGDVLDSQTLEYGATPIYSGSTPTRNSDAQYTYDFSGWSPKIETVTGNATYVAQYSNTIRSYQVAWQNYDGALLDSETYEYGEIPVYKGLTPLRDTDDTYDYTFSGWTPEITAVASDCSYIATFSNDYALRQLTLNANGGVCDTTSIVIKYGDSYELPIPTSNDYFFVGWKVNGEIIENKGIWTYSHSNAEAIAEWSEFNIVDDKLLAYKGSSNEIIIPSNVTEIATGALRSAMAERIVIGPNVNKIGFDALPHTYIEVDSSNTNFCSVDGVLFTKDMETLIIGRNDLETYKIPSGVKNIERYAFYECDLLTSIDIPNSVVSIGEYAFWSCHLESIYIPKNVVSIGSLAISWNCHVYFCEATEKPSGWDLNLENYSVYWNVKCVTEIDDFEVCLINDSTCLILKYVGDENIVRLPATFEYAETEYSVIEMFNNAFENNTSVNQIYVSKDISYDYKAIDECSNLRCVLSEHFKSDDPYSGYYSYRINYDSKEVVTMDGFKFLLSANELTATVVDIIEYKENLVIPNTVFYHNERYTVTAIRYCEGISQGSDSVLDKEMNTIFIPLDVTYIDLGIKAKRYLFRDIKLPETTIAFDLNYCYFNCIDYTYDSNFEYVVHHNDTVSILSYLGNDDEIYIPSTYTYSAWECSVTRIEPFARIGTNNSNGTYKANFVYIPSSISYIGIYGIWNNKIYLEHNELPDTFDKDWNYDSHSKNRFNVKTMFNDGEYLYSISNNGIASIERYYGNDVDIVVPNSVEIEGIVYPIHEIHRYAFFVTHANSIIISEGIQKIESSSFGFGADVNYIFIPSTLACIEYSAFYFGNTSGYTNFVCSFESKPIGWDDNWVDSEQRVTWGFEYNAMSFYDDSDYRYLLLENNKALVFKYLGSGGDVTVHALVNVYGFSYDVVEIWRNAFTHDTVLSSLTIEDGILKINSGAIYVHAVSYTSHVSIYIPQSVIYIGGSAINRDSGYIDIYCYADSKPDGWAETFYYDIYYDNPSDHIAVIWGYSAA